MTPSLALIPATHVFSLTTVKVDIWTEKNVYVHSNLKFGTESKRYVPTWHRFSQRQHSERILIRPNHQKKWYRWAYQTKIVNSNQRKIVNSDQRKIVNSVRKSHVTDPIINQTKKHTWNLRTILEAPAVDATGSLKVNVMGVTRAENIGSFSVRPADIETEGGVTSTISSSGFDTVFATPCSLRTAFAGTSTEGMRVIFCNQIRTKACSQIYGK